MTQENNGIIYTVWEHDGQTVTRYLRQGECNCCGICCVRTIKFSVVNSNDSDNQPLEGFITFDGGKWLEVGEGVDRSFYRMQEFQSGEEPCIHLGCDNRCDDYENRPSLCRTWPNSPEDLAHIPECSYSFTLIDHLRFDELKP
jgi:Fe-S-cluster containining protein